MDWIYYIVTLVVAFLGVCINVLGLPGNWVLVIAVAGYAWLTGFDVHVGWAGLISLAIIGLLAEGVEFLAGSAGAGKAGGTKRGMIGALIGGFAGAILLSPIFIIGPIIGAVAGAFIGAFVVEYAIEPDHERSMKIGIGAAKGRFIGIISKLAFGFVMFAVAAFVALPTGTKPAPAATTPLPPPTSAPLLGTPGLEIEAPATAPATDGEKILPPPSRP